jgi:hypothetical protein
VLGLGFLAAVYFKLEIFRNIMQFSRWRRRFGGTLSLYLPPYFRQRGMFLRNIYNPAY